MAETIQGLIVPLLEDDGKQTVVPSPATEGMLTYFCGAADNLTASFPASGRGDGQAVKISFTGSAVKSIDLQFKEVVEVHDGQMFYKPVDNWTAEDRFTLAGVLDGTVVTTTASAYTNCVTQSVGGLYDVIIPVPTGFGTNYVDLSKAVPVPAANKDGFWDCDYFTGAITASEAYSGSYNLITAPVTSYLLKNMPMGHPLGDFDIDVYKTEWIHPNWKLRLTCDKKSAGSGTLAGWLMMFRQYTT